MKIISVKEFNQKGYKKFKEAVDQFEFGKGGFPFLPMYQFQLDNGDLRQKGFVATKENSHRFFLTKRLLDNYLNSLN